MKYTVELVSRAALKWMDEKPFSKKSRARRKANRARKRAARRGELTSAQIDTTTENDMKLLEKLAELRTSTKSGFVGLLTLLVMGLPFADTAESYLRQACDNPDGAIPFLIGGAATWVTMFISARLSRTPAVPGKL